MATDADAAARAASLLTALQFADSFFPGGGTAFSWGLESLVFDGHVRDTARVLELVDALVAQRWAGVDRPLMRAAHAATSIAEIARIDALCEASTLGHGAREASRRLGTTQLRVHAELGLGVAVDFLALVHDRRAVGHLAVVQGALWSARGLTPDECDAMAVSGLCTAVVGAAIRLGLLGHLDAQRLLLQMRERIARVLADESPSLDDLWSGAPAAEIAAMRHEPRSARLFAN